MAIRASTLPLLPSLSAYDAVRLAASVGGLAMGPTIDTSRHPDTCNCFPCRYNGTGESGRLSVQGLHRRFDDSPTLRAAVAAHNREYGQRGRSDV